MKDSLNTLFRELNPEQQKAVEATEGPVLVFAGAGSGKTRVLTYRIAFILKEQKASPWEILAMTFTNKAAGEMKNRIQHFGDKNKNLWIGTFHSIFAKILRWEAGLLGYSPDFVIYDADDKERLIKTIMEDTGIPLQNYNPRSISESIGRAKNGLISSDNFIASAKTPFQEVVSRIYPEYQNRLRINNAFDFEDLITVPLRLFSENPEVLEKYQRRFKYILVDEYQDTNKAQYRLVYQLAKKHRNLCVVGDDDQSIYRWRGADVRNILEFEKDFPDSKVFKLEQNYRSTQTILIVANSVVEKNAARKAKKLWSAKEMGEKVDVIETADEREEAQKVVEKIKEEVFRKKRTFRDFAILYRTNAQSRALEDDLRRSGMSYVIVGGVRFYERKEIKDILAYLKTIVNTKDSVSLKRIINFPLRGIGDSTTQKMEQWALERGLHLFESIRRIKEITDIPLRIQKNISNFYDLIQKYISLKSKISPNELVRTLVDEIGLMTMYKQDPSIENQSRAENIREFLAAVSEYVDSSESPSLSEFLEQVSLITDVDAWDDKSNAITLMTLHCAKGLEFPVIFITGMEEGLFPISRSEDEPEALEEERRLFYVGLTRAKEKIYLSWAEKRRLFNESYFRLPSRFLDELDSSCVHKMKPHPRKHVKFTSNDFKQEVTYTCDTHPDYESYSQEVDPYRCGTRVHHQTFGKGKIVSVEGKGKKKKVVVRFDSGGQKKFLVQYAQFEIL